MIDYYKLIELFNIKPEKMPVKPIKPWFYTNSENMALVFVLIGLFTLIIISIFLIFLENNKKILTVIIATVLITGLILELCVIILGARNNRYEAKNTEYLKKQEKWEQYQESQKEINEILDILKIKTDKNKMRLEMEKLKKFCKVYYSKKDPDFCTNNEINRYTVNVVFKRIYENDRSHEDAENAMKYIYSGN